MTGTGIIVAIVGDLHINSSLALRIPKFTTDDGEDIRPSKGQRWLWQNWIMFWSRVEAAKEATGFPVVSVFNGELADLNRHTPVQHVTMNPAAAVRLAGETLQSALAISDKCFVLRGTEAHTGVSSHLDEIIAADIGAEQDDNGNYSRQSLWLRAGGVTFDISHHPGMGSCRPWTAGNAAQRLAFTVRQSYVCSGDRAPDIVIRGHNHRPEHSGKNHGTEAWIMPSWKLCDNFGHRIGGATLPVGGGYFICEGGRYDYHAMSFMPKRDRLVHVEL